MRTRLILSLGLLGGCLAADEPDPLEVSADEPLPIELAAGDIVRAHDISVVVPERGESVTITVEAEDGTARALTIRHPLDGAIEVISPAPDPVVIAAGATAVCQDGAYKLAGHKWTSTYKWRFQASSTPDANSTANVETALKNAAYAITSSRNDCGLADQVSATQQYLGRTTIGPNVTATSTTMTCGNRDGTNAVGFGRLPTNYLGVACSWFDGAGTALEGDVRLDRARAWYALAVPEGCTGKVGIQPVATHEFGHVFGLGHVSEASHPNMTMSTANASCTNSAYSLGLGDVRGLRQLY